MQTTNPSTATARRAPVTGRIPQVDLSQIVKRVNENGHGDKDTSAGQLKIEIEFKLSAREAKKVAIAGSFNGWSPKKTPMKQIGDVWQAKLELPRGRYEYRFVVDGNWVSDPNAKESVANPFGGSNSVVSL